MSFNCDNIQKKKKNEGKQRKSIYKNTNTSKRENCGYKVNRTQMQLHKYVKNWDVYPA